VNDPLIVAAAAVVRSGTLLVVKLTGEPLPAAELAALAWTTGADPDRPFPAPALRNHVVPRLTATGLLPGD
jgi:hypothetical protein